MKIVLTGATGKLGGVLRRQWGGWHELVVLDRNRADLNDPDAARRSLDGVDFDALVNCAACSSPEQCEADPGEARRVNAEAPEALARLCRDRQARLVHFSSDYVLAGEEPGLKDENAPTGPINEYGRSKLEGEQRVLEADPSALVCRVSWVYNTEPPAFFESVLRRAMADELLEAVGDKFSMPCCAKRIARTVMALLRRRDACGVFHLAPCGEPQSWHSYACKVVELAHAEGLLDEVKEVREKRLADLPQLAAPRPRHTAMHPGRLRDEPGWAPGTFEEDARARIRELLV